jgi:hypothetical protein
MAKKTQSQRWQASPKDAVNIASIRMYMLTIEHLALAIYRSDPSASRPRFVPLQKELAQYLKELRKFAKSRAKSRGKSMARGCPDPNDELCDGLCYPPGDCSRGQEM